MKKNITITLTIALILACNKKEIKREYFVSGEVSYLNDLTNQKDEPSEKVYTTIEINNLPEWVKTKDTSNPFILGSFFYSNTSFNISSSFKNEISGINYKKTTKFNFEESNNIKILNIELESIYNYTLRVKVTDSLGNPVYNTDVYLYNNYTFLETYKGNESIALKKAKTNSNGYVIFNNLDQSKYYTYAEKIIPINDTINDTIHSFISSFDPNTINDLYKENLNERYIIIK